jgi:hypothetical protein
MSVPGESVRSESFQDESQDCLTKEILPVVSLTTRSKFPTTSMVKRIAPEFIGGGIFCIVLKTQTMKKIKKQTSVRSERSETPVSQVRYVLCYERYSSYRRTAEKNLKQPPVTSERPVSPVSQLRYVPLYERHGSYCRTFEKMKNSHPHVSQVPQVQVLKLVTSHVSNLKKSPFTKRGI